MFSQSPFITPTLLRYDGEGVQAGWDWTGVAKARDGRVLGSAVLHESGIFMLTAAHLVDELDMSATEVVFHVDGQVHHRQVTDFLTYPGAATNDHGIWHDLGVMVLNQAAPVAADRYALYRGNEEVGEVVTLAGYGTVPEASPSQANVRRSGLNTVDALGSSLPWSGLQGTLEDQLFFDYDSGLSRHDTLGNLLGEPHRGLGGREAFLSPGDSGGGMFIHQDGEPFLAGINSYITGFSFGANASSHDALGALGAATRVSSYADWIDSVTGMVQEPLARSTLPPPAHEVPLTVNEGHGVWFLVQLGAPAEEVASVEFFTRDGTALAGYDYIPTEGVLTLEPGQQWAKIWVQTLADNLREGNESFSLVLTNPQGASFPPGVDELTAQRTIVDDVSLSGVTVMTPELFDVCF